VTELRRPRVVLLLFFVSGAAGLVYQISWSRQIGIWFGHTAQAAAIVLAAFFAGLALGNEAAARLLPRVRSPLVGYGVAEIAVAAWALFVPVLLEGLSAGPIAGLVNHDAAAVRLLARAVASLAVLLPATTAMGATLPFVAEWASPAQGHAPRRAAAAYAVNTAGGVAGVVLATSVLLLFAGVEASARLAAAASALVGIAAIAIARRETAREAGAEDAAAGRIAPVWWVVAAISGFGTLAVEVLYVRVFALTLHNSTYTFGCVVAVFLVGLAAGAAIVARIGERVDPRRGAAVAAGVGALALGVSLAAFRALTGWQALPEGGGLALYLARALGVVALVVLPPVALLGCVLPFGWIALRRGGVGAGVGRLVAVNTVAAAAGSLAAEFALVPVLDAWGSVVAVAGLYLATAAALALRGPEARRSWTWLAPAALLLLPALLWGRERPFLRAGEEILREWRTPYGLFDVARDGHGELALRQDRQYVHGSTKGTDSERRQGHLPLLLHRAPRRVLFLGLGTGITSSVVAVHPEVEAAEVVELVPEVVEASRLFVEDLPKRRIVVNDARHHLAATDDSFDVIVSDLFFPWHSGTGYLYTVEHYRAGRTRLAEGGLFAQWIALYQVGLEDFLLIADSFASVFPVTTLWRGEFGEWQPLMLLVGSEEPLALDGAALARRISALPSDAVLGGARDLLDLYAGDWSVQRPGRLNTDEHPRVEFLAPVANRAQAQLAWRLGEFYRRWLERLPVAGVRYAPRPSEALPALGGGRIRQLVGGGRGRSDRR
jgi:spermidine synthase